jgi:hypothetical protein
MKTICAALVLASLPAASSPTLDELSKLIGAAYSCGFADGMEHAINELKGMNKPYGQESCLLARQSARKWGFALPPAP